MSPAVSFSWAFPAGTWFLPVAVVVASGMAGSLAIRRGQPALVFVSGLLLCAAGSLARGSAESAGVSALLSTNAFCLALGAAVWTLLDLLLPGRVPHVRLGRRRVAFAVLAVDLAIVLLGSKTAVGMVCEVLERPHLELGAVDWLALTATAVAILLFLWDRRARLPVARLYALGLVAIGMEQIYRDFSPGKFFIWAGVAEWAGYVLVTALLGWALRESPLVVRALRIRHRWCGPWFPWAQASLAALATVLAIWISIDPSFDGMGHDMALFGLSGHLAGCPTALMLIGGSMLMAWQTRGPWRAGWQYAAMVSGVMFTSFVGWAVMAHASGVTASAVPWMRRRLNLAVSATTMTLWTRFGFAQVLPRGNDWITRGRRAAPVFAGFALLMLAWTLIRLALG